LKKNSLIAELDLIAGCMDGWVGVKPDLRDCIAQSNSLLLHFRFKSIFPIKLYGTEKDKKFMTLSKISQPRTQ
jgi:hypothetical protein